MNQTDELERLRAAKRRALQIADERSKENAALLAEVRRLRAIIRRHNLDCRPDGD